MNTTMTHAIPEESFANLDASRIGEALIAHAKIQAQDVERILALQSSENILFGEAAKRLGLIKESDIKKVLSEQYAYAYSHDPSQINKALIAAHTPFSEEVERLRSLRGQLMMRWFDLGHKTLAITSTQVGDAAHLVTANLAIVFSQLNKKTLLVDANLRAPMHHQLFDVESRVGLSNILANRQGSYQLSRHPALPNLSILSAGTQVPNPQELLSNGSFSDLMDELSGLYDVILIECGPLSLGADYLPVVAKAKAAIVVTRQDVTTARDLHLLQEQLNMTGAQIIGSVIQEL
jgi:protein-tyrosine kinase